jgi:hypothetical protein
LVSRMLLLVVGRLLLLVEVLLHQEGVLLVEEILEVRMEIQDLEEHMTSSLKPEVMQDLQAAVLKEATAVTALVRLELPLQHQQKQQSNKQKL